MSEKKYPIRDVFSGDVYQVPESLLSNYRDARDNATGRHRYEPVEDIEGAQVLDDGTEIRSAIPKDRWQETAREGSPFRLPYKGMGDALKSYERERKMRQIAREMPAGEVAIRSFLSGISGGLTTAMLDTAYGEEYEQTRAMGQREHWAAHFGGRAASLIALGLVPIPGLSAAAKARGIGNVENIFELSAVAASKVGGKITGTGYLADFARRFGTTMTFAAVSEAPLSLAMASADIVDNNKEWTMEAVASEFATQYALGLGISAATSFTTTALFEFGRGAKGLKSAVTAGLSRYAEREFLRGKGYGAGDVAGSFLYRMRSAFGKSAGMADDVAAQSRWRFLQGIDDPDLPFARDTRTVRQALDDLKFAQTPKRAKRAAETIMFNVDRDHSFYADLALIRDNPEQFIAANKATKSLLLDSDKFARLAQAAEFKHPRGLAPSPEFSIPVLKSELAKAGAGPVTFKSKNYMKVIDETLNIRRGTAPTARKTLDEYLERAIPGITPHLNQFDEFDRAARALLFDTKRLGRIGIRGAYGIIGPEQGTQAGSVRANLKVLENIYRGFSSKKNPRIVDPSPFREFFTKDGHFIPDTRLNDLRVGMDAVGAANRVVESLEWDARPLFRRPPPVTRNELLAAQIETVVDQKLRMVDAIKFAAVRGGGARHTAIFGGVYLFRDLKTYAQKQDAFVAYREAIMNAAATPEALQGTVAGVVGPMAYMDMEAGVDLAGTIATMFSYLNQQMPHSGDPWISPRDYSATEIENFLEVVGAVMRPDSVVATCSDGSCTAQAVDAVRTVYPRLWEDTVLDITQFVMEYGDKLDHQTLIGFDTFTGYALGIVDSPAPEFTIQPPYAQTTAQARSIGGPENQRFNYMQMTTPAQKVGSM
jgi:hypothetical protein